MFHIDFKQILLKVLGRKLRFIVTSDGFWITMSGKYHIQCLNDSKCCCRVQN